MPPSTHSHSSDLKQHTSHAEVPTEQERIAALAAAYVPGSEAEKKLLRKLDMRIVVSGAWQRGGGSPLTLSSRVSGLSTPSLTVS